MKLILKLNFFLSFKAFTVQQCRKNTVESLQPPALMKPLHRSPDPVGKLWRTRAAAADVGAGLKCETAAHTVREHVIRCVRGVSERLEPDQCRGPSHMAVPLLSFARRSPSEC